VNTRGAARVAAAETFRFDGWTRPGERATCDGRSPGSRLNRVPPPSQPDFRSVAWWRSAHRLQLRAQPRFWGWQPRTAFPFHVLIGRPSRGDV